MASCLVTEQQDILSGLLTYKDEHGEALADKEVKDTTSRHPLRLSQL